MQLYIINYRLKFHLFLQFCKNRVAYKFYLSENDVLIKNGRTECDHIVNVLYIVKMVYIMTSIDYHYLLCLSLLLR